MRDRLRHGRIGRAQPGHAAFGAARAQFLQHHVGVAGQPGALARRNLEPPQRRPAVAGVPDHRHPAWIGWRGRIPSGHLCRANLATAGQRTCEARCRHGCNHRLAQPQGVHRGRRSPEREVPLVHVLALDIDGFTELNELHGLVSGDAVLRQMALRCTEVAAADGRPALVARVGPDEFAIALADPHAEGGDAVQSFASRLYAKTALPFDLGEGKHIQISVSVGLSSLAQGCASAAEALLHASAARQEAVPGLPMLQCYEAQDGQRRMALALRDAVRLEQITVAYQPKVNLASGQLSGVEALARWVLPDGSSISPAEFIPLAERRGLIGLIGDSVMEQALAQIAAWQTMGLAAPVVAVNFSALQFQRQNYVQHVALALDRHGIPARLLEIELTESLLFGDIDAVMLSLKSFRNLGVALSIDDFGTGYSSLAYLRRFPVQYLKIDRQFVSAMGDDASACEIVRLIVDMAHRLNLRCIAEGIETEAQLKLLQSMGCDEGQGFLLARPLDTSAMQGCSPAVCPGQRFSNRCLWNRSRLTWIKVPKETANHNHPLHVAMATLPRSHFLKGFSKTCEPQPIPLAPPS